MTDGLGNVSRRNLRPTNAQRQREEKRQQTQRDIEQLVQHFHALLPREQAQRIGAIYARYTSRFQDSILDQVRKELEEAVRRKVFVPLENICFDLAVRGFKSDREGLNQIRALLRRKAVDVLFLFATNRLFRKTYRSLQFVEEEVVDRGIQAVFVNSGVDTADTHRWRSMLNMHSMMDESVVTMYADHVRAAHEGLLDKRFVFGTVSFGYAGQDVPGELTRRCKPRKRLVIDPLAGPFVQRIFAWFVEERLPISEIVRRLNSDSSCPPPPKAPSGVWTHNSVRQLLRNPRYRGWWRYGLTETVWISSRDYARQMLRQKPLKEVQIEELRLVPDAVWYQAQALLDRNERAEAGRKPRDGDRRSRPRLLNGLFRCPVHDRRLYVGGVHGKYMFCKDCRGLPANQRALYSQLPRVLALRRTCETVARLLVADEALITRVIEICRQEAERLQQPNPRPLVDLNAQKERIDGQIRFILRNPGETEADQRESEQRLRELRAERLQLEADIEAIKHAAQRKIEIPTEAEIRALLKDLRGVLEGGIEADPVNAGAVRELIDRLTDGCINLYQQGEPSAQRGWLEGRFRLRLLSVVVGELGGAVDPSLQAEGNEVVIDYREPDSAELLADEVKRLYDQGLMIKEIARLLGRNRNLIVKALGVWCQRNGQVLPDGRARRSTLSTKHVQAPQYREIAEEVKRLSDQGWLFHEIAQQLGCDRNTVTSAWRFWHTSRNLRVPDGRTRRKTLDRKSSTPNPPEPLGNNASG